MTFSNHHTNDEFEGGNPGKKSIRKVKDKDFKVPLHLTGDKKNTKQKGIPKSEQTWEIDLHIENLIQDHHYLSNGEIMEIQLRHCRQFIEKARNNKAKKIVIIHGVGKGVLKQEIYAMLQGLSHVLEFYNASLQKYGQGATEVQFLSNPIAKK